MTVSTNLPPIIFHVPYPVVHALRETAAFVIPADAARSGAAELAVVSSALAATAGVAGPRAAADIAAVSDFSVPAPVFESGVDSPELPRSFAFPSISCYARSSSSAGASG